tara:strand:- start:1368 stop:1724 length:357 start_codon:yes stop_codon:yes gene_type:complete
MLFQVIVRYDPAKNPVRTPHGMQRLMDFARWIEVQTEYPDVRPAGQVYWSIDEDAPEGYGIFAAPRRQRLEAYLTGMRRAAEIEIHEVKPLAELLQEGAAKLEGGLSGLALHRSLDHP